MKHFNEWLAIQITKGIGTMWYIANTMYSMVHFLYVQKVFRKVLEQHRENRHLLDMARAKNSTGLWTRKLVSQWSKSAISTQENLPIIKGRNTRRVSNRPFMSQSTMCKPRSFGTSDFLYKQLCQGNSQKHPQNSLSTRTRIYFRKYIFTQGLHRQEWQSISGLSQVSQ